MNKHLKVEPDRTMADSLGNKYEQDTHLCWFFLFLYFGPKQNPSVLAVAAQTPHSFPTDVMLICIQSILKSPACAQCIKHWYVISICHHLQERMEKFDILLPV